jgi:HEPN domain-containing protein
VPDRSEDWITQAARDLESSTAQKRDGFYEWSCFIAQQAAEKAIKAVYQRFSEDAWSHSLTDLLKGLGEKAVIDNKIFTAALRLDRFYIPARYPNGWPSGTPAQYITEEDAGDAIGNSGKILRFCQDILARSRIAPGESPRSDG